MRFARGWEAKVSAIRLWSTFFGDKVNQWVALGGRSTMRAAIYLLLGLSGMLLALFLGNKAHLRFDATAYAFDSLILLLALACLILLVAAASNFAIAYAVTVGRVASVRGTRGHAEMLDENGNRIEMAAIKFAANLDGSSANTPPQGQLMIFVANWRPRSCKVSEFLTASVVPGN